MPETAAEPSALQRLIAAIRKRLSSSTLDEQAAAGKEAAQGAADALPEGVIPHKGLDEARRRRAEMERLMREE
jgi:hypothetical protein